jgi:hypothetical protein
MDESTMLAGMLAGWTVHPEEKMLVADLHEDPGNVNEHSDMDLTATKNSLVAFGQVETLVVHKPTGKVIGGNGRLRIMQELGWTDVKVIPVDGTDAQLKTLGITLNKTPRNSDFNFEKLTAVMKELDAGPDSELLALTGFADFEIGPLLAAEFDMPEIEPEEEETPARDTEASKLDSRGMTIQFSVGQRDALNDMFVCIREELKDFSMQPADCVIEVVSRFLSVTKEDVGE